MKQDAMFYRNFLKVGERRGVVEVDKFKWGEIMS